VIPSVYGVSINEETVLTGRIVDSVSGERAVRSVVASVVRLGSKGKGEVDISIP